MNKAVILDLNGVVIKSPYLTDRMHLDFGVPADKSLPVLNAIMDKVRLPDAPPVFSLWEPHLDEWGVELSEEEFLHYWFSAGTIDSDSIDSVRALREKGVRVLALSNNFRERSAYDEKFPILKEMFDKIYFSWQSGLVKPDSAAFSCVISDQGLAAEYCWYCDDSGKNIETARQLGMNAVVYEGPKSIYHLLDEL